MSLYASTVRELPLLGRYYSLTALNDSRVGRLPFCIRVLLESAIRNCDGLTVTKQDVENILNWEQTSKAATEIRFKPSRVLLQDFTGVPAVVDLAAMRDAVQRLGGDVRKINPTVPVDLVIDHSVQVDQWRSPDAIEINEQREFGRNNERFAFLKWGSKSFDNLFIVPPGAGIVHQVNLEYLARVVFKSPSADHPLPWLYPDTVVGTDSHTTMIDGLGVVGWGVGGIEAEAVMLGQPISMTLPPVVGFKLIGKLRAGATATDLVLTITEILRQHGVVGKFVEFCGRGCEQLAVADRATIANMAPEYGATMGFFPVDSETVRYLRQSNRDPSTVSLVEQYLRAQGLFHDPQTTVPIYSEDLELDLDTVQPSVAGPKRPQDLIPIAALKTAFGTSITAPISFKGFGKKAAEATSSRTFEYKGRTYKLTHGSIVIAAITSCTNTSNPSVMISAGLLARNAVAKGLTTAPFIKTSLAPGSGVVMSYLNESGLTAPLSACGFDLVAYGCTTCIGNSGDLCPEVTAVLADGDIIAAAVLSGNRNFEGRVHPLTQANYLMSPVLVVAYAIAGTVSIDLQNEPLGTDGDGNEVFLKDVWPTREEIHKIESEIITPHIFKECYDRITKGNRRWDELSVSGGILYEWDLSSTYIHRPPFFLSMNVCPQPIQNIINARCLLHLGDSVTTDHISPAGKIAVDSPAAQYLSQENVRPLDFNTYGSRRGNDLVMVRGTYANIRLNNKLLPNQGPKTVHWPTGSTGFIYDIAEKYASDNVPLIVLAGKEYGSGSSRDWAAKGTALLGIKAVIAESYERIHRSNLIGMGVLPLEFLGDQSAKSLGLTGDETFTITINQNKDEVCVSANSVTFTTRCRIDTQMEWMYFKHGGILQYVIRKLIDDGATSS